MMKTIKYLLLTCMLFLLSNTVFFANNIESLNPDAFITTWRTTNANESINIPTKYGAVQYNYNVDWGDGNITSGHTTNVTHTYTSPGDYEVKITGLYPQIYFVASSTKHKLIQINQWGSQAWITMENAFNGCINLEGYATDIPNLAITESMNSMFLDSRKFNQDISNWDVSNVIDMVNLFANAFIFNQNISNWNVSNVTNMECMFCGAKEFNQPIQNWDVSNVTNMGSMFYSAKKFNQPIGSWDVSNVTSMSAMFSEASLFNQDISTWDVSNVTLMNDMFFRAYKFNQPIGTWNVSNVTNMNWMFYDAIAFNQPIGNWIINNVTGLHFTFYGATNFNQPIGTWDVSNVTDLWGCFSGASSFNQPIGSWDVSNVINFDFMFRGAAAFNQPLNNWNLGNAISLREMFNGAASFNQPLNNWDLSNVNNMQSMFYNAQNFNQNINSWDISNVTNIREIFSRAYDFNQPLDNWNINNINDLSLVFAEATSFNQPLNSWNVSNVTNMALMFYSASSFNQPLDNWNTSNLQFAHFMFYQANSFDQSLVSWNIEKVTAIYSFLNGAELSSENYEATLQGWASQLLKPNLNFHGGSSKYCDPYYRQKIIDDFGWSITDGGVSPACITSYLDNDNDTYGDATILSVSISLPSGYVLNDDDCDDTNPQINPAVLELCDNIDNNCNGQVDENCLPFITTWRTTNPNEAIEIPTHAGSTYNYNVDWGDGNITTGHTAVATHTYANAGDYSVKISGLFPRIYFNNSAYKDKIISIDQWGSNQWTSMANAFHGCSNLNGLANDVPDLSLVTDMSLMFYGATIFNQPLDAWNVSNVQNMFGMFSGAAAFNQPIDTWDVSNVTDMSLMFFEALNFNQPIGAWNTGNLMHMKGMFNTATHFNQSIENWDVSNITDMTSVFFKAFDFNQPLNTWDVSNVTTMAFMFQLAYSFNQPLDIWDVSNVQELYSMFIDAVNFDQSLASWNLSSVTDITYMFVGATLSLENYESTLQGWSSQNLPSGLNFHGGNSQYCDPINRSYIISTYGWTFTDGGVSPTCITSYRDFDNDTYGDASLPNVSINLPIGYVLNDDDCDDTNALINPASPEICDCFDNNCDGLVNNGITCAAPIAKCFTTPKVVTIGPSKLIYNGPGLKDVYRVDLNLLDNASISLCNPIKEIARMSFPVASTSSSSSTFDWTTLGACDDILLNGSINNEDKGYSWEDCLPVTIGGDNNKIRTYKLKVTDIFGTSTCSGYYKVVYSSSASPEIIDIDKYGLTAVDLNENLIVYPNPSLSELNILIDVNIEKLSTYSLFIYDVLGKEVKRLNDLNSGVIKVNTESLNAGTYNVVVKSGDDVFTKRWVKL